MTQHGAEDLYAENHPQSFWRLLTEPAPSEALWAAAVHAAAAVLPPAARVAGADIDRLLFNTLGEGQFGPNHWQLSPPRQAYYMVKPLIPRPVTRGLRRLCRGSTARSLLGWPIEERYARFQWQVVRELLKLTGRHTLSHIHFWPEGRPFAFAITHDVETGEGQRFVRAVADLDASYGFRSSFNFVPEGYRLDWRLFDELQNRGFEVGIHGLNHDGKGFRSYDEFMRRAERINHYLKALGVVGFRAPLMHRNPAWLQALDIEYDLSFFDSDPYEPMPGGTMSPWPFMMGRFVELPYTLVQDHTLTEVLRESTPNLWLQKVDFIRDYNGLALVITHPDYLRSAKTWQVYADFLRAMRDIGDFWHALPREVARWWRGRATAESVITLAGGVSRTIAAPELAELDPVANAVAAG